MQKHASREDVRQFLQDFMITMKTWDVLYRDDRGKNLQTLLSLEITPAYRKKVLESLVVEDYAQGPLTEKMYGGSNMWVFGKTVKKKEVYIKISLGVFGSSVICISFHLAEHTMNYPLKAKT